MKKIATLLFILAALAEVIVNGATIWRWTQMIDQKILLQICLAIILVISGSASLYLCAVDKYKKSKDKKEQELKTLQDDYQKRIETLNNLIGKTDEAIAKWEEVFLNDISEWKRIFSDDISEWGKATVKKYNEIVEAIRELKPKEG